MHNCEITRLNAQINDLRKDMSSKEYTFKQKLKEVEVDIYLIDLSNLNSINFKVKWPAETARRWSTKSCRNKSNRTKPTSNRARQIAPNYPACWISGKHPNN